MIKDYIEFNEMLELTYLDGVRTSWLNSAVKFRFGSRHWHEQFVQLGRCIRLLVVEFYRWWSKSPCVTLFQTDTLHIHTNMHNTYTHMYLHSRSKLFQTVHILGRIPLVFCSELVWPASSPVGRGLDSGHTIPSWHLDGNTGCYIEGRGCMCWD